VLGRQHHPIQTSRIAQHEQIADKQEHRRSVPCHRINRATRSSLLGRAAGEGRKHAHTVRRASRKKPVRRRFDAASHRMREGSLVALGEVEPAAAGASGDCSQVPSSRRRAEPDHARPPGGMLPQLQRRARLAATPACCLFRRERSTCLRDRLRLLRPGLVARCGYCPEGACLPPSQSPLESSHQNHP